MPGWPILRILGRLLPVFVLAALWCVPDMLHAAGTGLDAAHPGQNAGASSLDTGAMVIGLAGGLALFLYGMDHLSGALKVMAGSRLRMALGKMTRNRFMAVFSGASITALLQSSSVTTVLVVGFVSAGLMTLPQSVAVIMGANIGSTLTAQIIAFDIGSLAPLMIAFGFALSFFARRDKWSQSGRAILGLGLLFFGMSMMSDAMAPLRSYQPFVDLMAHMTQPFLAILIAAAFTALVQSSAATTGIVIVLAGQGLVTLEAGIALIFGANIGTCATAMLGAIGKNRNAWRAAVAHVVFNVVGVLIWLPFIPFLADIVRDITPNHAGGILAGMAAGAGMPDISRQIANAHSIFNIFNVVLMIGAVPLIARGIEKILPDRKEAEPVLDPRPKYLDSALVATPSVALAMVKQEVLHMAELVFDISRQGRQALIHNEPARLAHVADLDDGVDALQDAILAYGARLARQELSATDLARLNELIAISNHLEAISDVVSEEMTDILGRMARSASAPAIDTIDTLVTLLRDADGALRAAMSAVDHEDSQQATLVIEGKASFVHRLESIQQQIAERVGPEEADIRRFRLELALIERIHRVFTRARRIARNALHLATPAGSEKILPETEMPAEPQNPGEDTKDSVS